MELDRNKINAAMARKGYNIAKPAKIYGVSAQRMRTILNSRKVSPTIVGKLADALECDVTEILED